MFCPLWRCLCEPQCSDQTLQLCDCTEEVDLDMLKCKVFPSLLSSWLEGTKATSVPVQSFTAWSAWRQNCRQESRLSFLFIRHGYHFCKGRSKQSKPKKKVFWYPVCLIFHCSLTARPNPCKRGQWGEIRTWRPFEKAFWYLLVFCMQDLETNKKACGWVFWFVILALWRDSPDSLPCGVTHRACTIYSAFLWNTSILEVVFLNLHSQFNHLPHNKSPSVGFPLSPALHSAPVKREPLVLALLFFFRPANHPACLCPKFVVFAVGPSVSYQKPGWAWRGILSA